MTTTTQAFLFNADAEGVPASYGGLFDAALLESLSAADQVGVTSSRVLRGDILISSLCERLIEVSSSPKGGGSTIGHDMNVYRTVIWDLADAIQGQWNTLDLETFPFSLRGRIFTALRYPRFHWNFDRRLMHLSIKLEVTLGPSRSMQETPFNGIYLLGC